MKTKQYAFNSDPDFIDKLDNFISLNQRKYRNRTQFILQAVEEKMDREVNKNDKV